MRLENRLEVSAAPDVLFDVLLDVERVAPCMPGASLEEHDGDRYTGTLKVKVGPIGAQYRGSIEFLEVDRAARKVVLKGSGRETRGQGSAEATITAHVDPTEVGSVVELVTDLQIRGKVAQFGRGVLADVSQGLVQTFADNLQQQLLAPATGDPVAQPAVPAELNVLRVTALPLLRRALPVLVGVVVVLWLLRRRAGRSWNPTP